MAKARRNRKQAIALRVDPGPAIRLDRGDVELVDRPEPENPKMTVRGARVRCHWRVMDLTTKQIAAAEKLECLAEISGGACWQPDGPRVARPVWQQGHPTERQVDATTWLRLGKDGCGQGAWFLLEQVVCGNIPLYRISEASGESQHVVKGRLLAALDRLVEAWQVR